jgi:uncharacterized protein YbbC (DUF1343 family)
MRLSRREALILMGGTLGASACRPDGSAPGPTATPKVAPAAAAATEPAEPRGAPTIAPSAEPTPASFANPAPTDAAAAAPTVATPATSLALTDAAAAGVLPGVDVLLRERKGLLAGKRLGLITNATGRARDGRATIDVLFGEKDWRLVALFSPEHGIRGDAEAGQSVDASIDLTTGLPVFSLYGDTTRPTDTMLRGLDMLVYDIQDVGARVYTYISTLLETLRASAEHGVPVVVLDRPDPVGGDQVDGNVLDPRFASFVGPAAIAMRYGMTIGELGQLFNTELGVGANLHVVPMQGWQRVDWLDATHLAWVNPSPNLRSLSAAAVYTGTVLFEGTNLSEGRGTDTPFEWIGASWMDGAAWAAALERAGVDGVRFAAAGRVPRTSKFAGQLCQGVTIEIVDRTVLRPMAMGVAMLEAARAVAGSRVQFSPGTFDRLCGTDQIRKSLEAGMPASDIARAWEPEVARFRAQREPYLLY